MFFVLHIYTILTNICLRSVLITLKSGLYTLQLQVTADGFLVSKKLNISISWKLKLKLIALFLMC